MFYKILKEICKEKNTSPSAVCVALKYSKSNVTEWKKGRSPKIDMVAAIAKHLQVSPARFFEEAEN